MIFIFYWQCVYWCLIFEGFFVYSFLFFFDTSVLRVDEKGLLIWDFNNNEKKQILLYEEYEDIVLREVIKLNVFFYQTRLIVSNLNDFC